MSAHESFKSSTTTLSLFFDGHGEGGNASSSTRRYHENGNGSSRTIFDVDGGGKLGGKEDGDDGIDPSMIKEEVYGVLEAIDYHKGVLWGDNGQKVINAAAKAREDERLRLQKKGKKRDSNPITDDLRLILVAAKKLGVAQMFFYCSFYCLSFLLFARPYVF